ncbi:MAG TPA: site-2 protease family protein [Candidatus Dormibacteraeota bacterium]|nr:site-2 protease family protein [Candidatus Dormibacteraeota bacterium]
MASSIRLGRIFGIKIGINWSLVFVFALIAWTVATQVLPADVPGQPTVAYWVAGAAGAVAFYGCLLAHELAHALVARRNGVKVGDITLWLFGGVSRLDGEPKSAGAEALIAGVGPLTSLGVALIAFVLSLLPLPALVVDLFAWLAFVNVALALFNLVPAFPLDGGRLLSSFFWWRSGSRQRGVHSAVRIGRLFAYLMIAFGVFELFTGSVVNGIWIAFVGWFLLSAGSAEETGTAVRGLLRSVPVSAAMTSPVVTIPDWLTVAQFLDASAPQHTFTTYPVHDPSDRLTGIVRLGDLARLPPQARAAERLKDRARPISEVPTASPSEDLAAMIQRVGTALDQRVLVFDNGRLAGIVSPVDVARLLAVRQQVGGGARSPGAAPGSG